MADWTVPTNTTAYTSVLSNLRDRDVDAATLFVSSPSNYVTGMIRYNRGTDLFEEYDGGWNVQVLSIAGGGTGASTAATARTALGLGTLATQNSNSVTITGGSITGTTIGGTFVGNLTGNVTGNCTGNAGTVTNGLYTSGSYADPSWLTSLAATKLTGTIADARLSSNVIVKSSGTVSSTTQPAEVWVYANSGGSYLISAGGTIELFTGLGYDVYKSQDPNSVIAGPSALPDTRASVATAGVYLISAHITMNSAEATTIRRIRVIAAADSSAETIIIARNEQLCAASGYSVLSCSGVLITPSVPYYIAIKVYCDKAATVESFSGQINNALTIVKVW